MFWGWNGRKLLKKKRHVRVMRQNSKWGRVEVKLSEAGFVIERAGWRGIFVGSAAGHVTRRPAGVGCLFINFSENGGGGGGCRNSCEWKQCMRAGLSDELVVGNLKFSTVCGRFSWACACRRIWINSDLQCVFERRISEVPGVESRRRRVPKVLAEAH